MSTGNKESLSSIQNLPPEILTLIFSNLTIYELAEVQKTCKAWYAIAQNTPTLWRKSEPFFRKYGSLRSRYHITKFVQGVQTLSKLSAGKLDEIFLRLRRENTDNAEIASFLESIPNLSPTLLRIVIPRDSDKCLQIIGQCKSLRELDLGTYGTPFKDNVFKNCPIQEAKLQKLTLNQNSFRKWRSEKSCLSVSSSIKTFILDEPVDQGYNVAQAFDFLHHCRQSIENFAIIGIGNSTLRRGVTGLCQEIVFPNLVKASFTLWYEVPRTDNELIPSYCFKCLQIQELNLPSKYFLRLFDSVESVKDVILNWDVDDLAEMFRIFPNTETFVARLHSEEMLRSLVDLVPKQLKHLILTVVDYNRYGKPSRMIRSKQPLVNQLLELVRHSSAKQYGDTYLLQQDGEIEFFKFNVHISQPRVIIRFSMCKRNFVEIFTELSKMEAFDTSSDTNGIVSSD